MQAELILPVTNVRIALAAHCDTIWQNIITILLYRQKSEMILLYSRKFKLGP
jgi:hypothetical protein